MTYSRDKIAAVEKTKKKGVPILDLIKFRIMHVIRILGE